MIRRDQRRKCGHCITMAVRVNHALPAYRRGVNARPRGRGESFSRTNAPEYCGGRHADNLLRKDRRSRWTNPFCNRKNEILMRTKHVIFPSPEIGGLKNLAHGFSGPMSHTDHKPIITSLPRQAQRSHTVAQEDYQSSCAAFARTAAKRGSPQCIQGQQPSEAAPHPAHKSQARAAYEGSHT